MAQFDRIDVFMPQRSQYSVLHRFTEQLFAALQRKGLECRLLQGADVYEVALRDPPDLTICFNGAPLFSPGIFLADKIQRPHLSWLVDPPYHYWVIKDSPYITIACDDQASCQLLRECGHRRNFFSPQAVEVVTEESAGMGAGTRERDISVLCLLSFFDFEAERRTWWELPYRFGNLLEEVAERCIFEAQTSFITAFREGLARLSDGLREPILPLPPVFELLKRLEFYLKGWARAAAVCALPEGVVHLCDERWRPYLEKRRPDIVIHPAVSYEEGLALMRRSKVVLANSIRSPSGGSERVLNALACGAVPLTNLNPYMASHFVAGEEIAFYQHNALDQMGAIVMPLLLDEVSRSKIAAKGLAKVIRDHSWDLRAEILLKEWEAL